MDKKGIAFSIPLIAIICAISAYGFLNIAPGTQIPSHIDIYGNVDDTTERNILLIAMPALALFISLIFSIIPVIDPRHRNVERSKGLYYTGWFGALSILAVIHGMLIISAVHQIPPDPRWILLSVSLLIIVVGNFMAKSRSTWFLGLRTPWTLTSEHSWIVANRLCGWIYVLTGALSIAISFMHDNKTGLIVLTSGLLVGAVAGIVSSFFAWRNDPERA